MGSVSRINIDGKFIGIVGLREVLEDVARECAHLSEEEIGRELITRVVRQNYIPRCAEGVYVKALIREFKRYMGQEVEEKPSGGLRIVILGPGCARCDYLEREVRETLAELGIPAELLHVDDLREIARYRVMGTPALVINDRVVSVGKVPGRGEIKGWIRDILNESPAGG